MEPSLPTARGLAIAGEWIAGGVGTHETALASPERVDLGEGGEPTGVLREESCWHFRDAYIETTDDEYMDAMRGAIKLANARGVAAVHDKDGWLGALRFWQRLESEGALTLRVWQSLP